VKLALVAILASLATAATAQSASGPSWSGNWQFEANAPGWKGSRAIPLAQKGSAVTGRHGLRFFAETVKNGSVVACNTRGAGKISGRVKGRKLTGTITFPNAKGSLDLTMAANGREFIGQMQVVHGPCKTAFSSFNATRR
jgi:hypothetical protein